MPTQVPNNATPKTVPVKVSPQLGLDFDAPASTPVPDDQAESGSTGVTPSISSREEQADRVPVPPKAHWRAPDRPRASQVGMDALAMACAIQNAQLVRALMELPEPWDFNAPHEPDKGRSEGFPSPLVHLLSSRAHQHWSNQSQNPGRDDVTATALDMVERGADFLLTNKTNLNAVTLCAINRREEFFESLVGHERFDYALMGHLRVGSVIVPASREPGSAEEREKNEEARQVAIKSRKPLLGLLIGTGQLRAAKALIEHARFPVNGLDPDGRLPIGYCRSLEAVELLLSLGARPGLADSHGLNALARAQDVPETEVRDKMITRIANELKKNSKSDPSIMATLQAENISALLEAAQNAPKSSLLKTISAFKFDVAKARDPETLVTPLMAACLGGRMASAQHLLSAGSDINACDAEGVPASAYLLAGNSTSNGPKCEEVAKAFAHLIDFSLRSKRGWPVVVEAAYLMGTSQMDSRWNSETGPKVLESVMSCSGYKFTPQLCCGADGTTLMEAYAQGRLETNNDNYRNSEHFQELMALARRLKTKNMPDRSMAALLLINSRKDSFLGDYDRFKPIAEQLEMDLKNNPQPCPQSARVIRETPGLAAKVAKHMPTLYAFIEAAELASIAEAGGTQRKPSRL